MSKTPAWQRKEGQDPKGGLNPKGRASYRTKSGKKGNLKAPVKGAADTPEKLRRKGSFLAVSYTHLTLPTNREV